MNYVNPEAQNKSLVIPVLSYSRCSGYYANYNSLNLGKKAERDERVYYKIPGELNVKQRI